jgi:TetR/AcrR family transcriptional regulator, regulator of cefoperazone and chloramphenicol sensitivity
VRSTFALDEDLTPKARIRDAAMARFAADGVAATSIRAVAADAGVSPALVIHHFGTKDGLVQAVEDAVVHRLADAHAMVHSSGPQALADYLRALSEMMRREPTVRDYIGRTVAEGGEAAATLFHRLFAFASNDRHLVEAGIIRGDTDPFWRAMHQVLLFVAPLAFRQLIDRELGASSLEPGEEERALDAKLDLLQHGLYVSSNDHQPQRT